VVVGRRRGGSRSERSGAVVRSAARGAAGSAARVRARLGSAARGRRGSGAAGSATGADVGAARVCGGAVNGGRFAVVVWNGAADTDVPRATGADPSEAGGSDHGISRRQPLPRSGLAAGSATTSTMRGRAPRPGSSFHPNALTNGFPRRGSSPPRSARPVGTTSGSSSGDAASAANTTQLRLALAFHNNTPPARHPVPRPDQSTPGFHNETRHRRSAPSSGRGHTISAGSGRVTNELPTAAP
jgi:hypothetical protein